MLRIIKSLATVVVAMVMVIAAGLGIVAYGVLSQSDHATTNRSSTGVGMTFDGRFGIDLGGVVIPFDGSSPRFGIGF